MRMRPFFRMQHVQRGAGPHPNNSITAAHTLAHTLDAGTPEPNKLLLYEVGCHLPAARQPSLPVLARAALLCAIATARTDGCATPWQHHHACNEIPCRHRHSAYVISCLSKRHPTSCIQHTAHTACSSKRGRAKNQEPLTPHAVGAPQCVSPRPTRRQEEKRPCGHPPPPPPPHVRVRAYVCGCRAAAPPSSAWRPPWPPPLVVIVVVGQKVPGA